MARQNLKCPTWLDEDGRREWSNLEASGVLRRKDPETAAVYCFTIALWTRMRSVLERLPDEGTSCWTTRSGQEKSHPALEIEARLAGDLLDLSEALDLEPKGREAPHPSRVIFLDEGS